MSSLSLGPALSALAVAVFALSACTESPVPPPTAAARSGAYSDPAPRAPTTVGESPALTEARQKVRDLDFQISRAESERRQLSPPVRITDSRGTTFDQAKQQTYERELARADRKIADLRREKTVWELRVNRLRE